MRRLKRQVKKLLLKKCLEKVVRQRCPDIIPLAGKRARNVNCYEVALDKGIDPYLLVRRIGRAHVSGLKWDPARERYSKCSRLLLPEALGLRLKIIHHVGACEVEYEGALAFWLGHLSRLPYLRLFSGQILDDISRLIFNRRSRLEASRGKLLQFAVDEFATPKVPFDSGTILFRMYKHKWIYHPAATKARTRTDLFLSSWAETGELKRSDNGKYMVAPLAFKTLADAQESQRRHWQLAGIQIALLVLTLGTMCAALIQAGILRLPPLLRADCQPKNGVAYDCTVRYHLWPNNIASDLLARLRKVLRRDMD